MEFHVHFSKHWRQYCRILWLMKMDNGEKSICPIDSFWVRLSIKLIGRTRASVTSTEIKKRPQSQWRWKRVLEVLKVGSHISSMHGLVGQQKLAFSNLKPKWTWLLLGPVTHCQKTCNPYLQLCRWPTADQLSDISGNMLNQQLDSLWISSDTLALGTWFLLLFTCWQWESRSDAGSQPGAPSHRRKLSKQARTGHFITNAWRFDFIWEQ